LLLPRNPRRSLIIARLTADAKDRMPQGGTMLSDDEIGIIGRWISGGAAFDGEDVTAPIGQSMVETKPDKPPVKVVMADGTESVSFKDDVAPWMVNICLRCHSGANPRGGYNITTFEQLLSGGDTGSTIVPGDPGGSYIVDLVLRQDPIKMPAGNQVQIKRSQAQALEKWIKEGAHFDGDDGKATLRSLVPTEEALASAKLAAMSTKEFSDRRIEQAESTWKRVAPREEAKSVTSENLYVYGNLPESRLEEFSMWGEEQVASMISRYKLPGGAKPWRGRLIVFAAKARFDYEEFNTVLLSRRTPRGVSGHSVVSPNFNDAYVALFDVGDADSADALNARQLLNSILAQAYLTRDGGTVPDWLKNGFGLLECGAVAESQYLKLAPQKAGATLATIDNPATIFDDGTFAPEEVGPVGFLLTRYLINNGGIGKLQQLVRDLRTNRNAGQAVQATYGQSAADIGQAFLRTGGR
ncbi:MAG: c-type cytochrome domain-containing protein, partial [Fuerstiella sp.]